MKQDRVSIRVINSAVIGLAYGLILLTQLPHIYEVYQSLEREALSIAGISTAWGAAIAFELSVALLTWRLVSNKAAYRSPWTRPGIAGFLIISVVANVSYYFDIEILDQWVMPGLLAVALPMALWLYAEEFSSEAGKLVRRASVVEVKEVKRESRDWQGDNACWCGWVPESPVNVQQQIAGHTGGHTKEVRNAKWETTLDAWQALKEKYPQAYANGGKGPQLEQVAIMRNEVEENEFRD